MGWIRRLLPGSKAPTESGHPIAPEQPSPDTLGSALMALDALLAKGDLIGAEAALTQIRIPATQEQAHLLLRSARLARLKGEIQQARDLCDGLLGATVDPSLVQHELGLCCVAEHQLQEAIDHFAVAVELTPENGPAWLYLGKSLARLDRWTEAEQPLRQAVDRIDDDSRAEAWYTLGETQRMQHRFIDACATYRTCLSFDPYHLLAHIALGHVLVFLEQEQEALTHYEAAMGLSSQLPATLRLNVGSIQQHLGHFDQARDIFDCLVAERPGDHTARWYLCQLDLLQCRWSEGWANYPARFAARAVPYRPMPYPPWDGRRLTHETLLVLADEGLGDEIMFASCLPDVAALVKSCIVECEPRLQVLFKRSFPSLHVVATQRENSTGWLRGLPQPSLQIFAGDLPRLLRAEDAAFTSHTGYLKADPRQASYWKERLAELPGSGPIIGISWRGGITGTRTKARSIAVEQWGDVLNTPGVRFVNLQYGNYQSDLQALEAAHGVPIHDFPDALADYDETAALVFALDLVVTVCTAIVHLSGSLGKPVWILTPSVPGWRYTANRDRLPWYPTSRIFRQHQANDWHGACRDLSEALCSLTNCVA